MGLKVNPSRDSTLTSVIICSRELKLETTIDWKLRSKVNWRLDDGS